MALSLSTMKCASAGPWMSSSGTTRKNAGGCLLRAALGQRRARRRRRDVREPGREERLARRLATAPDVDGPMHRDDVLVGDVLLRQRRGEVGRRAGVSPARSWILSPYFDASVLTAYFAQLSCSLPRKPASPVSGVMKRDLQRVLAVEACVWLAADEPAPAVDANAAATMTASASANPPLLFIPIALLGGWSTRLDVRFRLTCCAGDRLLHPRARRGSVTPAFADMSTGGVGQESGASASTQPWVSRNWRKRHTLPSRSDQTWTNGTSRRRPVRFATPR